MNIKRIKELIELMNENDLTEIEIEREGTKIRLIKKGHGAVEQVITTSAPSKTESAPSEETSKPQEEKKNYKEVKSPMVGTFYRSPSPDVDSYVEVGDTIQKGDVLCIVEAMKLMNEIKAEFGGKIAKIAVENAEPVEFGQVMFLIESL